MLDDARITPIEWMKDTLQSIYSSTPRVLKGNPWKHTHKTVLYNDNAIHTRTMYSTNTLNSNKWQRNKLKLWLLF